MQPTYPSPARPSSIIAQLEGSGMVSEIELTKTSPLPARNVMTWTPVGSECATPSSKPISPGSCAPSDVAEFEPKTRQLSPVVHGSAVQPVVLSITNDKLRTPAGTGLGKFN